MLFITLLFITCLNAIVQEYKLFKKNVKNSFIKLELQFA